MLPLSRFVNIAALQRKKAKAYKLMGKRLCKMYAMWVGVERGGDKGEHGNTDGTPNASASSCTAIGSVTL